MYLIVDTRFVVAAAGVGDRAADCVSRRDHRAGAGVCVRAAATCATPTRRIATLVIGRHRWLRVDR